MATAETPLEHRAHHLAGAIYGTILATTVVAAASTHPESLGRTTLLVLGTSVVFWAAHVYAVEVAARLVAGRPLDRREVLGLARAQWPMLQSAWPILVTLLLGVVGVLDPTRAVDVAMAVGIGALFTYGVLIGRQEGASRTRVLLNGLAVGSLGLAVLLLKVLVH